MTNQPTTHAVGAKPRNKSRRALMQFLRALAILVIVANVVIMLRSDHGDWLTFAHQYPLWPR